MLKLTKKRSLTAEEILRMKSVELAAAARTNAEIEYAQETLIRQAKLERIRRKDIFGVSRDTVILAASIFVSAAFAGIIAKSNA